MLDHRVVAFAISLPLAYCVPEAGAKWLLRQLRYKYVPPALVERPKMGFGGPMDSSLRGALRDWARISSANSACDKMTASIRRRSDKPGRSIFPGAGTTNIRSGMC